MVVTVERRLFLFAARAAGWPWCMGGGEGRHGGCTWLSDLGASSSLPRQRDAQSGLRPPPSPEAPVFGIWRRPHLARGSVGPATLGLAAIPRPNGAEQRTLAELGLKICAPVKGEQGESFHPVSPQLGSRETRSYYPRTPPSVRGEAAGLPGRFEDQARPGRLQPSTLRSPVPLPAVSRHRHFRQPTRPGLSPRPDHPPWGALTAQRVPPLPPPSPKWRRRPPILLVAFL